MSQVNANAAQAQVDADLAAFANRAFGKVKETKEGGNANYLRASHAIWRINKIKKGSDFQGKKDMVFVEMTCLRVIDPRAADMIQPSHKPHVVHEDVALCFNFDKQPTLKNWKMFLIGTGIINRETMESMDFPTMVRDIFVPLLKDPCPVANMVVEIQQGKLQTKGDASQNKPSIPIYVMNKIDFIHPSKVAEAVGDPAVIAKAFPNGLLDNMIAAWKAAGM